MPAQTRGFLFSDLRGYSAFVERRGDVAARELLARYRRIVREVLARFGGAEIRTEGDSFYVVFGSVGQAVEAGLAIQAALGAEAAGDPIRAGIGIHAGEVEDDAEQGIVSGAVNIAARLCAAAQPGEVLVSETVRALTRADIWIEGGAEELIVNRAGVLDAPAGTCAHERRAFEQWSAGPLHGMLLCFSSESLGSTLYWTYEGSEIFAKATRADGDLDALLRWWNDEAQYRRP